MRQPLLILVSGCLAARYVLNLRNFERRADTPAGGADMALRHDVRQRIVAGDVEAAQKLLQQQRPQLLAIPPTPRPQGAGYGPGCEASPALVADPADGVPMEEDDSARDEELEDGEMGRGGGASPSCAPEADKLPALWSPQDCLNRCICNLVVSPAYVMSFCT